jgi:hypothetical protein
MFRELWLMLFSAGAAYAWLCAVGAPVIGSMRSLARRADTDAWSAFALAVAGAILWAAIAGAALLLLATLQPRAGLALLDANALWPRLLLGTVVWGSHWTFSWRIPRFGARFETATALAIVALAKEDTRTLERVGCIYTVHAIDPVAPAAAGSAPTYGVVA